MVWYGRTGMVWCGMVYTIWYQELGFANCSPHAVTTLLRGGGGVVAKLSNKWTGHARAGARLRCVHISTRSG
jgi:hypothetical protein